MRPAKKPVPPLDGPGLERLALRYVERFATTRVRLTDYLNRKVRTRGFDGVPPDTAAIAQRLVDAGYVDDRAFGEARAAAMARRGLGARRVAGALHHAGIGQDDMETIKPAIVQRTLDAALAYARKRRIGPFASTAADPVLRQKHLAAMIRAGHGFALARHIVTMQPGDDEDELRRSFDMD